MLVSFAMLDGVVLVDADIKADKSALVLTYSNGAKKELTLAQSQTIVDADVANLSDRVAKFSFLRNCTEQRLSSANLLLECEFLREVGYAAAISLTLRLPATCGYTWANGALEYIGQVTTLAQCIPFVAKTGTVENPVVPATSFEIEAIASTNERQRRATIKVTVA